MPLAPDLRETRFGDSFRFDARTQKITEQFAGGLFKSLQNRQGDSNQDSAGNVPVLSFAINTNAAEAQMRLNPKSRGEPWPRTSGTSWHWRASVRHGRCHGHDAQRRQTRSDHVFDVPLHGGSH
jgi:hypothetical protein